ncbi:PDZ domain-containing protein [bacterium]|nr:PDZ domain-containing protein [bacterium]
MKKKIFTGLILLITLALNADFFGTRLSTLDRPYSISQGEVTFYALRVIKNSYLDKSKIKIEDLFSEALNAIQEEIPESVLAYDKAAKRVNVQIYNQTFAIPVKRMKDIIDIVNVLRQVYALFEKNYIPEPPLEINELEYIAVNGILKKLDPHSYAFTPRDFEEFNNSTEGSFGGLGIVIGKNDDNELTIISPIQGTPATRAGLEANDVIVQINDESTINMPLDKAVERMRGEPGTDVTIRIRRAGIPDLLTFTLTREIIKIESVLPAMPKPGIGYINLSGFMGNTYATLVDEIGKLKKDGMKALVLDMRNNSGGLLSQAIKISDLFLAKGEIVSTVSDDEDETNEARPQKSDILDIPIIVMINEGSASATEIVAAALKKNNRATVIGRKSFGKGSVQNLTPLPHGGGLKFTIAQYLTPGKVSIQSVGITPDIELRPSFVHSDKLSLFNSGDLALKESDLEEHIISQYAPKKPEFPRVRIRYFKEYKDIKTLREERRREKHGEFRSDDEIDIAVEIASEMLSSNISAFQAAENIKDSRWNAVLGKLREFGIDWKPATSLRTPDKNSIKVTMLSDKLLDGGRTHTLTFKAEAEGEVENLVGILESSIPYLRNVEIPFGTFTGSVERSVNVKLPEAMPWRSEEATVKLYLNSPEPNKEFKSEKITLETRPVEQPDLKMSLLAVETSGNRDGVISENEELKLKLGIKNVGKGGILEGKALLINKANSEEIFITNGNTSFTLEPDKSTTAEFSVKINKFTSVKKGRTPKLIVSIYDYKTKYAADFTLEISQKEPTCRFVEKQAQVLLEKDAPLFESAEMRQKLGVMFEKGTRKALGSCGEATLLENGYWVSNSSVTENPDASAKQAKYGVYYPIAMPKLNFDKSPVTTGSAAINVQFSVSKSDVRDVFAYLNNKKIFYKRLTESDNGEFSIPVTLTKHDNNITVTAENADRERRTISTKHVIFTQGKKEKDEEAAYEDE